ncbi:aldehyde dehydrogenase [Pseudohyphozyma bogoriensis]|nr:aldehyde dehydrogenase [Pseudohyphozyma bogoriensis]
MSIHSVRASLEELLSELPEGSINAVLAVLVPSVVVALYWTFIRVPSDERAVSFSWTAPPEAEPGWRGKPLKNASILSHLTDPTLLPSNKAASGSYITCYAPASGHHLSTIPSHSKAEIEDTIRRAESAQLRWRETTWAQRRQVMRSLLEWCVRDMEGIARVASRDSGKTLVDAAFGEILVTAEKLRWVIAYGEQYLTPESRPTNMLLAHKQSRLHFEPLGVVCAIVSWNYSFHNVISPMIAALFSGNAIVLKPSENVAWSTHIFVSAFRSCLEACGHSPDVVQIVTCLPDSVEALTGSPRIKHITFIGSEEVGKLVAIKGAEVGTPVVLELGGKDPCVILKNADIKFFAATWARAAFQAGGQNCIGAERFIVASEIYDQFVDTMTARVKDLVVGDVLSGSTARVDVGGMVTDRLFSRLEKLVESAVEQGARLVVGGKRFIHPDFPEGHYFSPTLLVDVTPEMEIAQTELFAPVMTVMKFDMVGEAIEIANGTRYGLGASVFGRKREECRYVGERLKCGMVCYNDFGVFYLNQSLPFGGVKSSGYGRFAGPEGLRGLCNLKAVTEDRFHGLIQTGIPPLLAYPIKSGSAAWTFVSGLIALMAMASQVVGLPRELLPTEYVLERIGVHTRWTVVAGRLQTPTSAIARAVQLLESCCPSPKAWKQELGVIVARLPLLWTFAWDLARNNGRHFWIVTGGKLVSSMLPALELIVYTKILDIARAVPETGLFDHRALALAFGARVGLLLVSHITSYLSDTSEKIINSRFTTTIQTLILRIHCMLDDEALATTEVQSQITLLQGLGGSSAYGRMFDPLGFLSVLNTALGMSLELGVLYWKVNSANQWLLGLSVLFIAMQNLSFTSSSEVIEHIDTTHDGYLRLQNLYKVGRTVTSLIDRLLIFLSIQLGTSQTFRREVNSLSLHSYLLSESDSLRHSLHDFQTTPLSTSPFSHARLQLRSSGIGSSNSALSLRSILLDLEKPITYTLFILIASSQHARPARGGPLMVFGDVALLENSTRNLHYRSLALRGYVVELGKALESMAAFYEGMELERRFSRRVGRVYETQKREVEGGRMASGMKIEFKNVTLRYPGGGLPALRDVSFTVLPGEVVAIVGFNGSGKTSVMSLLATSTLDYEGVIEINSINIRSYDRRDLAKMMSFTFQSTPALPFSIREYVALGSVEHRNDDLRVRDALRAAGADTVVDGLPDGLNTYPTSASADFSPSDPWASLEATWDLPRLSSTPLCPPTLKPGTNPDLDLAFSWLDDATKVGSGRTSPNEKSLESSVDSVAETAREEPSREYAVKVDGQPARVSFPLHSPAPRMLSGGQWQRIALAQSFFKVNTELMVLDEPGAPLDPVAEAAIFETILAKRGESTVMFSTHRFGVTARADKILMFDQGRVVEVGTHQELMALEGGQYRSLWEVQAKGFEA